MTREELLTIGLAGVSPEFQPDGRHSAEVAMEYIQKAIEGEKPVFEWTHRDKEGNLVPCEVWLVRLPSENKVLIRGSIVDITERKKAAEEIRANSELLLELYSYSQNIREEERTHIAREIHDELGQQLTGLKMDISWITRRLKTTDEAIMEKLTGTLSLIDTTIKTVRKIATELRPSILDDLGLVAALEWQGEEFGKRSDIKVNFTSNLDETILQPGISTALFRIYQELLTNVARHASAGIVNTAIYISEHKLHLSVEDNGTGFDTADISSKKTLGLRGIKERTNLIGGSYEIKTKPGVGTFVLISVPL
jgi:signal transduction histidine kinase